MSRNSPQFQKQCKQFFVEHGQKRDDLQKCLEDNIDRDVNFVCKKVKSDYLLAIGLSFCKVEYDSCSKCQKDAGKEWASKCFNENTLFGQCVDATLKKLYVYGLENQTKNPAAAPT
eukprot:PhF_6_TR1349/c0_g1_i1/m.2376